MAGDSVENEPARRPQVYLGRRTQVARVICLGTYFSLLVLLVTWHAWLVPSAYFPVALVLLVMVSPLLLPLRGLLHGRPYTHMWAGLLALLYFTHGLMETYANPAERLYAVIEAVLALSLFSAAMLYARWRSRELKANRNPEAND